MIARNDNLELARRGIGDFTENGGAARAGRGRQIRWALVKGFVREEGEREGFFGIYRDTEMGRG